jgi:endonuclease-3
VDHKELPLKTLKTRALAIISILQSATKGMVEPAATTIVRLYGKDPFLILVSCILSLRTRDPISLAASQRLFEHAKSPKQLASLLPHTIEKLIYPVGFYRQKTKQLISLSKMLLTQFNGVVPNTSAELLSLPGVGPKTTNLVLSEGFNIPAICVDTHVHRISNRLGIINTTTPEKTEEALKRLLPKKYWSEYNRLMVMWGQNICVPISPFCSKCPLLSLCDRRGVVKSR